MQQKQGHPVVEDLAVGARRNSMLELDEAVVRGGDKTQKRLGARDDNQGPGPRAWTAGLARKGLLQSGIGPPFGKPAKLRVSRDGSKAGWA